MSLLLRNTYKKYVKSIRYSSKYLVVSNLVKHESAHTHRILRLYRNFMHPSLYYVFVTLYLVYWQCNQKRVLRRLKTIFM